MRIQFRSLQHSKWMVVTCVSTRGVTYAVAPEGAIPWSPREELLLEFYPCLVGSCFFVAGAVGAVH